MAVEENEQYRLVKGIHPLYRSRENKKEFLSLAGTCDQVHAV